MSRADPRSSFHASVRHLFRHLDDARALRENPLARAFFAAGAVEGERGGVAALRARILDEARACRSDDAADGAEHGDRRFAIVAALCAGEPPSQTAVRLGVSRRQYYRDRQAVCARIARSLTTNSGANARSVSVTDALALFLRRAATLREGGFAQTAAAVLDHALPSVASGADAFAVRLELADALVAAGDAVGAESVLVSAHAALRAVETLEEDRRSCEGRLILVGARVANASGRDGEGGAALDALAGRLDIEGRAGDVALEATIEAAYWHAETGGFDRARALLRRARAIARRRPHVTPDSEAALLLLEAHAVADLEEEFHGSLPRYEAGLSLSVRAGLSGRAFEAIIGMMNYHAAIGSMEEMYNLALRALAIARSTEGNRELAQAGTWISGAFLKTPLWPVVGTLLFDVEAFVLPGTLQWVVMKVVQGAFLARTSRYGAAAACARGAVDAVRRMGNQKVESIALRELGVALQRQGRGAESADAMRQAVELAESCGTSRTLALTYEAAGPILDDRRIRRLARRARVESAKPALQRPPSPRSRPGRASYAMLGF
jgi:tetratricopeptide (TPR) repeat protein